MDNYTDKLDDIYKQLENDRKRALEEFEQIKNDAALVDPRFRHLVREVGGQMLKLAVDASIGMAKILEPLTKNASLAGGFSKKELLDAIESLDGKVSSEVKEEELSEEVTTDTFVALKDILKEAEAEEGEDIIDVTKLMAGKK
jgi:hypothetical protein